MAVIYTHNDNPNPPHVFVVDVPTGETVGEFNLTTPGAILNPQAIRLSWSTARLYLADIGDPTNSRTNIALWSIAEPGPGFPGTLPGSKHLISYPFGPRDAEALAIHPTTDEKYIITRESPAGRLVRLPKPLQAGNNLGVNMNKPMPANVTDATFTLDGKWLLLRVTGDKDTLVYNGVTFVFDGKISTPQVAEGRSITVEPNGKCFLIGSEGQFAPIFRVCLPAKYQPQPPTITVLAGSRAVNAAQTYRLTGFFPSTNATITITRPNGSVFQTRTLTTDSSGTSQATFTPNVAGTWTISAVQTITGGTFSASTSVAISSGATPPPGGNCDPADKPKDILPSLAARQWKLTLPTPLNCGSDADEESAASLDNGFELSPYFYALCPDNAVVFRAPVNGSRTSNTSFPRSELREMRNNGANNAAWTLGSGQHALDIVQAVTHLPQRSEVCRVVTAQIHDSEDDICVISCDANSATQTTGLELWASLGNEHNYRRLTASYVLGRYFRVRMVTTSNGVIILYDLFDGQGLRRLGGSSFQIPTGQKSGCYFKAGCYTQATSCPDDDPGKKGTGYGEVRIKSLSIEH